MLQFLSYYKGSSHHILQLDAVFKSQLNLVAVLLGRVACCRSKTNLVWKHLHNFYSRTELINVVPSSLVKLHFKSKSNHSKRSVWSWLSKHRHTLRNACLCCLDDPCSAKGPFQSGVQPIKLDSYCLCSQFFEGRDWW